MPSTPAISDTSVTIIVRTVGHPHLVRALASLRDQTHRNLRIVLVVANPDFSPDSAIAGAQVAAAVEVQSSPTWLPRPQAANRGLDAARAEFIGFLDEDDWLLPAHVATLLAALRSEPGYALAYADTVILGAKAEVMSRGYWKQRFQDYPVFTIHAALFASRLVAAGCRFDERLDLIEDWDFWLQCADRTDFLHVREATACYDPVSGTSGTGHAANLDHSRSESAKAVVQRKWLPKYRALEDASRGALREASTLIEAGAMERARDRLQHGLSVDPGNPLLLNRLALCCNRLGQAEQALAALRRACDVDRHAFDLWLQLALLENACGQQQAAKQSLIFARRLVKEPAAEARAAAAARLILGD